MLNSDPVTLVLMIPALLMAFTFHEFGHAWVATLFGDDTPRLQGRLNLSPLSHLDFLGTVMILVTGFGWAKPVQVNTSKLRYKPWGDIAVSLAGVAMNFVLATLFFALFLLTQNRVLFGGHEIVIQLFYEMVRINVVLIAFNLIPVPPLDGFRVARYLFPPSMDNIVYSLYRMGPILLMLVLITHVADPMLRWMMQHVVQVIEAIVLPPMQSIVHLVR